MDFTAKNVVFVGGLGCIGYETCKKLIKKPIARLFILDIMENAKAVNDLQVLNKNCKVYFVKVDLTEKLSIKNAIKTIVDECKYIDILVNGAGILSEVNYELMININLIGLMTTTYEALPYMAKNRNGRGGLIINIASVAGLEPIPPISYTASKFGVVGFTRALAHSYYYELTGVAVTAICPGLTETPLKDKGFTDLTFDYTAPLAAGFCKVQCQTTEKCAEHLIEIIKANKNGSVWISDGVLSEVELHTYWTPKLKN